MSTSPLFLLQKIIEKSEKIFDTSLYLLEIILVLNYYEKKKHDFYTNLETQVVHSRLISFTFHK